MINSDLFLEQVVQRGEFKVSHSASLQLGNVWKASLLEEIADAFIGSKQVASNKTNGKFLHFKY